METEQKIVYSIINTVEKQRNDDSTLSERLIRGFIQSYRTALIADHSNNGVTISDECFQMLPAVEFEYSRSRMYTAAMKKIVRLDKNFGLYFEKNGVNIPVINSEEFALGLTHIINKYIPKAKIVGSLATLFIGNKKPNCAHADELNEIIEMFEQELISTSGKRITVDVFAVLDNPEDAPGYNWRTDPYPANSELIADIKTEVLRREFNIILNVKQDKITNGNDFKED